MGTDIAPETTAPTRGRPRQFTDEAVLDALVQLFWSQGYEATSMADIVEATGLNKSSLYSSFGSKEQLFEMALNRYVEARSEMLVELLIDGTNGLADVRALLESLWSEVSDGGDRRGCLAVNTSTELGYRGADVVDIGSRYRALMADGLRVAFGRAADLGEIDGSKIETYTILIAQFLVGATVTVRSGATDQVLRTQLDAANEILDSWQLD